MLEIIKDRLPALADICVQHGVVRLALFGSAARGVPGITVNDIDFVVTFEPMPPSQHAESYFGLAEDLEKLIGTEIDLLEDQAIQNPFFRQAMEETRVILFDAA